MSKSVYVAFTRSQGQWWVVYRGKPGETREEVEKEARTWFADLLRNEPSMAESIDISLSQLKVMSRTAALAEPMLRSHLKAHEIMDENYEHLWW